MKRGFLFGLGSLLILIVIAGLLNFVREHDILADMSGQELLLRKMVSNSI